VEITCPNCQQPTIPPTGNTWICPNCAYTWQEFLYIKNTCTSDPIGGFLDPPTGDKWSVRQTLLLYGFTTSQTLITPTPGDPFPYPPELLIQLQATRVPPDWISVTRYGSTELNSGEWFDVHFDDQFQCWVATGRFNTSGYRFYGKRPTAYPSLMPILAAILLLLFAFVGMTPMNNMPNDRRRRNANTNTD
jgi:hypothetical protein